MWEGPTEGDFTHVQGVRHLPERAWHSMQMEEILREGETDLERGLSQVEAAARLEHFGPNSLVEPPRASVLKLFLAQFKDTMVLMLLAAAAFSGLIGERLDAYAILAIVALNAALGVFQEYRAEQAIAALRQMTAPTAVVLRDGVETRLPATRLVPGDILLLDAGDRVPADARLFQASQLYCDESALTGESRPAKKEAVTGLPGDCALGDRRNMVHMGSLVTRGRARAVAVATGMNTEVGHIAGLITEAESEETPLMRRFEQLGKSLIVLSLAICAAVVVMGIAHGEKLLAMVLAGISLAVAAVPEGLPAIVTITLALGVRRMAARHAITRRLPAVETLGCATVICSDKTGTLTQNVMTVREVVVGRTSYVVSGKEGEFSGGFATGGRPVADTAASPALQWTLLIATLCNNASLAEGGQGDPTEVALLAAAAKGGVRQGKTVARYPRVVEIPFESARRRMSTVHRWAEGERWEGSGGTAEVRRRAGAAGGRTGLMVLVKGAPDTIADLCTHILDDGGGIRPILPIDRSRLARQAEGMARKALRVLAMAYRPVAPAQGSLVGTEAWTADVAERDLVFAGMMGMMDPPRPEVYRAVQVCLGAGIMPVMITGDHPATAAAVAEEIGLFGQILGNGSAAGPGRAGGPGGMLLTGAELDRLDDRELARRARTVRVYARVSPGHKLRIVRALKENGHIVAMTGDGVNDAPAVKEADIGVAMGISGTDVTKEASAMVLTDDNFASIVAAVEEGRAIYDNIRKFVRYLLGCNLGEIITVAGALAAGLPLPLTPIQILWMNLVTDGLPAMALGLEKPERALVRRPPRPPDEGIFARRLGIKILGRGLLVGLPTLAAFLWAMARVPGDLPYARSVAFATLITAQLIYVFDCRSESRGPLAMGAFTNWWLTGASLLSFVMLLGAVHWRPLQPVFETVPLGPTEWLVVLVASGLGNFLVGLRRIFIYYGRERLVRIERSS